MLNSINWWQQAVDARSTAREGPWGESCQHTLPSLRTTMSMMKLLRIRYSHATSMLCANPTSAVETAILREGQGGEWRQRRGEG